MDNTQGQPKKIRSSEPKYKQLKNILLEDIRGGKYPPHSKLPSCSELIRMYDVSSITVNRAKDDLVKEKAIYALHGKGCFVMGEEIPEKSGGNAKEKRILLMVPGATNEMVTAEINGIMAVVQNRGYTVDLHNAMGFYEDEIKIIAGSYNKQIAGFICHPSRYSRCRSYLLQLRKMGVPVVLINRYLKHRDFDCVVADNAKGAMGAVNYLIKMGHKRILYLGDMNYNESSESMERLEGYRKALGKNGLRIDPGLILAEKNDKSKYYDRKDAGYKKTKKALKDGLRFTAVFAHTDDMAAGAYKAFRESGISVPDEVSIVGFTGTAASEHCEVPITTEKIDSYRIGYCAARILLKRINPGQFRCFKIKPGKPFELKLAPDLIIRKSVKKIN